MEVMGMVWSVLADDGMDGFIDDRVLGSKMGVMGWWRIGWR